MSTSLLNDIKSYFNLDKNPIIFDNLHIEKNKQLCKKQIQNCSGIYLWFNKIDSKFYIGRAINLGKRPFQHISTKIHNKHLHNAFNLYKLDSFVLIILMKTDQISKIDLKLQKQKIIQDLIKTEDYYLDLFKHLPRYNVLNKNDIGTGFPSPLVGELNPFYGKKHSEKLKQFLSESRKGENNPMYNKPKSKEFIHNMTKDKTGINNHMSKKTRVIDTFTGKIYDFSTFKDCYKFLKNPNKIRECRDSGILFKNRWQILTLT